MPEIERWGWKIYDQIEDRTVLTLSADEAEHWDGLGDIDVTIVSWRPDAHA